MNGFQLPGGDSRTVVIGMTGSGKTTFGFWLLSHMRFDKRPWIFVDYKGETFLDRIGFPPLQNLGFKVPKRKGLYVVSPRADQNEQVEEWLWKIWDHGNIGLVFDEAALLPDKAAVKAILRQGRSKRIPVIACTQRPVGIDREFFTEAGYISIFRLDDKRDYKVVMDFTRGIPLDEKPLPKRWSYWYDREASSLLTLRPVPSPDTIVERLKANIPRSWFFGG